MAKVTIGGEELVIPPLNVKALKKIFPIISKMRFLSTESMSENPDAGLEAICDVEAVISAALERSGTPMTAEQIDETMLVTEMDGLQATLLEILAENKLAPRTGEGAAAAADAGVRNSTEISMPSSARSSPGSEDPTGT